MLRLTRLAISDFPGLPAIEVELRPMTALIGRRGAGKSRVLAAARWLLTGRPRQASAAPSIEVSGALGDGSPPERPVKRSGRLRPEPPLPACRFLAARDRLPPPGAAGHGLTDATLAEQMVGLLEAQVAAGASGEVLLVEEPELELNPQAQRHLYRLLRAYAERNQVIYSTRSPALLDAVHHDEIVRLDVSGAGLVPRHAPAQPLTDEQRLRLAAEFDHERTEMFFASAVLLVEGQTERLSLPIVFRTLGHDPDALGISITEVGGKGNLPLVARILSDLNIPHVVVYDADQTTVDALFAARVAEASPRAVQFELRPDFEAVARLPRRSDKVLTAWRRFHDAPPARIPATFREVVEATVALARAQPG